MKEADIRKYAGLMAELGLTGLEITEDNKVVRLERTPPTVSVPQTVSLTGDSDVQASQQAQSDGYVSVNSPMVGVFYAAPAENAKPFVSIGDRVEKGTVLCIIESMKLMNEICAEESGVISEICVTNGQIVEYGSELFRIKR